MGTSRESNDPFGKVGPNMEGKVDFINRQRSILVQREYGVRPNQLQGPSGKEGRKGNNFN